MSEFVTTRHGDRVAFDRYGQGPALVFVAGAGPFREIDPTTTQTAQRAAELGLTTVVYDRLGRGESRAEGVIDLDRELAALDALIGTVGGRAALCGHSSGSSISLRAAAAGLAVDALALWEAPLGPEGGEAKEWAAEVERRLDAGDHAGAVEHYMKDMPPQFLEWLQNSPLWPQFLANAPGLRADGQSLVWAESAPLADLLREVRVPVLAMVGEQTFDEMTVAVERILDAVPGAVSKRMPGAEHSWEAEPMAVELAAFVLRAR